MATKARDEAPLVVVAGGEVDFALGEEGGAESADRVVGGAEVLKDGRVGEGVVTWGEMGGRHGVSGTIDPTPFAQVVGDLFVLDFGTPFPLSEGDDVEPAQLAVEDVGGECVAGVFEEGSHPTVETVDAGVGPYAQLVKPVLALDVVVFVFVVEL